MMVPDESKPEMKHQATEIRTERSNLAAMPAQEIRRPGIYIALLLFISLAGLPILGISSLRHRLQTRVHLLAEALVDESYGADPVKMAVGESEPFPEEYERMQSQQAKFSNVIQMTDIVYQPVATDSQQVLDMRMEATEEPEAEDDQPVYGQGEREREAYELLLKSNQKIAAMVEEGASGLSFKSWAAAPMEDGAFWVNLTFTVTADGIDAQYIWRVDLATESIEPLSSNARTIIPD